MCANQGGFHDFKTSVKRALLASCALFGFDMLHSLSPSEPCGSYTSGHLYAAGGLGFHQSGMPRGAGTGRRGTCTARCGPAPATRIGLSRPHQQATLAAAAHKSACSLFLAVAAIREHPSFCRPSPPGPAGPWSALSIPHRALPRAGRGGTRSLPTHGLSGEGLEKVQEPLTTGGSASE